MGDSLKSTKEILRSLSHLFIDDHAPARYTKERRIEDKQEFGYLKRKPDQTMIKGERDIELYFWQRYACTVAISFPKIKTVPGFNKIRDLTILVNQLFK